jgi:hypothetical protein
MLPARNAQADDFSCESSGYECARYKPMVLDRRASHPSAAFSDAGTTLRTGLIAQRQCRAGEYRRFVRQQAWKRRNQSRGWGRFNFDDGSNAGCYGAIQRGAGAP